jgi:hypothetical protein
MAADCRIRLYHDQGGATPGQRRVSSLRCGPRRHRLRFTVIVCDGGHRSFAPSISPEMTSLEPSSCGRPNIACPSSRSLGQLPLLIR